MKPLLTTSAQRRPTLRKLPVPTPRREPACPPATHTALRSPLSRDSPTTNLQGPLNRGGHIILDRRPLISGPEAYNQTVVTNPKCGAPPAVLARRVAPGPGTAPGGGIEPRPEPKSADDLVATTATHRATKLAKAPLLLDRETRPTKEPPDRCPVTTMTPKRKSVCLPQDDAQG